MSRRSDRELLLDILEALQRIGNYTAGMAMETFLLDQRTIDAVVRNLGVIGEASTRLDDRIRALAPLVEWPKIIGLRHRIVHGYFDIDDELIWEIVNMELEPFKKEVLALLSAVQE